MTTEQTVEPTDDSKKKRTVLSVEDQFKVVDYLRAQLVPITGESHREITAKIAEATKVSISSEQLKYLVSKLPLFKLEEKIVVIAKSADPAIQALIDRIHNLEAHAFDVDANVMSQALDRLMTVESAIVNLVQRVGEQANAIAELKQALSQVSGIEQN